MTKIGFMGNFFGVLPPMQAIMDCDILCLIGTICPPHINEPQNTIRIEHQDDWIKSYLNPWLESALDYAGDIIIVPGIYDISFAFYSNFGSTEHYLKCNYLNNELMTINKLKIFGSPLSPYIERPKKLEFITTEAKLKDFYLTIEKNIDILLTYCPPFKILDEGRFINKKFDNLGSRSLKSLIDTNNFPKLKVHAFSHSEKDSGQIIEKNGTCFVNVNPIKLIRLDV